MFVKYKTEQRPNETQLQYYRRIAKAADQRLVRLEAASHNKEYRGIKNYAYRDAMKDIKRWSGKKAKRFNTEPPKDPEKLQKKIASIKKFLDARLSTTKGIRSTMKAAKTFNKEYGVDFTWQDLTDYYETEQNEYWDSLFGSKTALKTIGIIQANAEKIKQGIKDMKKKNLKFSDMYDKEGNFLDLESDSSQLIQNIYSALDDNRLNIKDLY